MDRVFSTRLDEDLVRRVDRFVKEKSLSKKGLIERALLKYLEDIHPHYEMDVLERSFGAWKRDEPAEETWLRAREAFNATFRRHSTQR